MVKAYHLKLWDEDVEVLEGLRVILRTSYRGVIRVALRYYASHKGQACPLEEAALAEVRQLAKPPKKHGKSRRAKS